MDEPTINFLSLPDKFKLQILKKLDWKSLVILKLVCRDFFFTIEKNLEHLDRPKVGELMIFCGHEKVKRLYYTLKRQNPHLFIANWKCYTPKNNEQYNRFLKERDFTEVKEIRFHNHDKFETVRIVEYRSHENKFDGHFFHIRYSEKYVFNDLETTYTIGISSITDWRRLYYDSYIKSNFLQEKGFFKENGSKLIATKLVVDCLIGNPNLRYNNISTESGKVLHKEISKSIFNYNYFNFEGRCSEKKISIIFELDSFSDLERNFYRDIFDKVKPENNLVEISDDYEEYRIETAMICQRYGPKEGVLHIYCAEKKIFRIDYYLKCSEEELIDMATKHSCSSDVKSLYHGIYINLLNGPLHRARFVIRILETKEHRISYNGIFLTKESLKKLRLFERNGSYLFMNKLVMNALNGNLILDCNNTSIDTAKPNSIYGSLL
uniref:F-box domain-containing protein n=1 Tax=Strongyloides venezuelensis TaxID=75913 RepID=A0A0K0EVS5_STRVS